MVYFIYGEILYIYIYILIISIFFPWHSTFAKVQVQGNFGGKIISVGKIPLVTCKAVTDGFVPVVVDTNLGAVASGVQSALDKENTSTEKTLGIVSGAYDALPFYLKSKTKVPKVGGYILGKYEVVPDTKTCVIDSINVPFPVKVVKIYAVSKAPSLR